MGRDDIQLVIFDFDGVLVDSEVISARTMVEALAGIGIAVDFPYIARHFLGRAFATIPERLKHDFGVVLPDDFEDRYRSLLLQEFEKGLTVMPGVIDVLKRMRVPVCIATSSSLQRLCSSMDLVGLTPYFGDSFTTSSEVARGKPAPDLFLRASEKAAVDPARCLVIEDSQPGLQAAAAAGIPAWHFRGGSHLAGLDDATLGADPAQRHFAHFEQLSHLEPGLF